MQRALAMLLVVGLGSPVTPAPAGEVTGFTLVDARTDRDVGPLEDGATVDGEKFGGQLNVRADVTGDVGSVKFELDGKPVQTESVAPYAVAGDREGDYGAWRLGNGKHTLVATPYSKSGAKGEAGKPRRVTFTAKTLTGGGRGNRGLVRGQAPKLEDVAPAQTVEPGSVKPSGERKQWHRVTLAFGGPASSETADPNPFLDYRLDVTFRHGDETYVVPGYYAADGDAAESGAAAGNVWKVHFAPDAVGEWTWEAAFRTGENVAVADDSEAGEPVESIHGKSGSFAIAESDKTGHDFRSKGRLGYVGERYLRFAGTGEWFLKCGADSPENFLAYEDFDNTPDRGRRNRLKSWQPHVRDWRDGDPTWRDGKGKGMIGALNYLASEGLNAFSFIPLTIRGDDENVFPYVTPEGPFTRFDCSKLDQWEIVFAHADTLGLYLHFKTMETENELLLDGGDLGPERKAYYRELIARYAHHLALNWNLGEEINNASTEQKKAWAAYFWNTDPYQHHIVIHNGANHYDLMGDSHVTGFSLQTNKPTFERVHDQTLNYIRRSKEAGKPWVVACDEPGNAGNALRPDDDAGDSHVDGRKNGLWGNVMAGGAGLEWYFGYQHAHSDLTLEDYRSRDEWWDVCRHMLAFFEDNDVPFWEMHEDDDRSSAEESYCFLKPDELYVVYLKQGGSTELDLDDARGEFEVRWYDPRNGGALQSGSVTSITGGAKRDLGRPPSAPGEDWTILVRRKSAAK